MYRLVPTADAPLRLKSSKNMHNWGSSIERKDWAVQMIWNEKRTVGNINTFLEWVSMGAFERWLDVIICDEFFDAIVVTSPFTWNDASHRARQFLGNRGAIGKEGMRNQNPIKSLRLKKKSDEIQDIAQDVSTDEASDDGMIWARSST
jgi:hypothetical protein